MVTQIDIFVQEEESFYPEKKHQITSQESREEVKGNAGKLRRDIFYRSNENTL